RIMLTQQYGRLQGTIASRHRPCTCLGHRRDLGHPTTTSCRCSDNGVGAHIQRSDVLATKRCEKSAWLRATREQPSDGEMRIALRGLWGNCWVACMLFFAANWLALGQQSSPQAQETPSAYSQPSLIGREVAVPIHLPDGQEFSLPLDRLLAHGKLLFNA